MTTRILSSFLWLALLVGAAAKAQTSTEPMVVLHDGRTLKSSLLEPKKPSHDWIVFLPGSGPSFKSVNDPEKIALIGGLKTLSNFLIMGKPGVYPTRISRERFEASFRRWHRIDDALEVMKKLIPAGDSIYLLGYSEGAYLAPELALKDERVKAVALIAGGTRGWLEEELNKAPPEKFGEMIDLIAKMTRAPESLEEWEGQSFATWISYSGNETLESLLAARVPTLAVHGDADTMIDVKSAMRDIQSLIRQGKPITSKIIPGADHFFEMRWPEVNAATQEFLHEQIELQDCQRRTGR